MTESTHADPKFNAKYGFCRVDCDECKRLDAEDTRPQAERVAAGIEMAFEALMRECPDE